MGEATQMPRSFLELAWGRIIDELARIRQLRDGWDGEGSPAPPPALVDGAAALARRLKAANVQAPDRVAAGVNATVTLEWFTPQGYMEAEVTSPAEATLRWVQGR
jgi:hypothetical protein